MREKIKIVIAHNHRLVGQALVETLSSQPAFQIVGWSKLFLEAQQLAMDYNADIIVTTSSLAGNNSIKTGGSDLLVIPLYDGRPSENGSNQSTRISLNSDIKDLQNLILSLAAKNSHDLVEVAADGDGFTDSLTAREREIYSLIAEGLSNQQIGNLLFITERTVKYHVSNVLRKLNVGSRTEAAVRYVQAAK